MRCSLIRGIYLYHIISYHVKGERNVSQQKDAETAMAKLKPSERSCNTSEMTLGRVLGLDLGILFDSEDHGREDRQSFESATAGACGRIFVAV
jgi:hypothetical protein